MINVSADWVSAIASSIAAVGVLLAFWQLRLTKIVAQLQFEDGLSKEYRDLIATIPKQALLGKDLPEDEQSAAFDEIYRYIDLTNEQICLRVQGRIRYATWDSWAAGIKANLDLPAFKHAWLEIKKSSPLFNELRRFESESFSSDPKKWSRA